MRDWSKYSIEEIKTGVDEKSDTRLFVLFARDYKQVHGADAIVSPSCASCDHKIRKFQQKSIEMQKVENSGFKLKPMYEGIQEKFGGNPVSSANLTDEKALELIKNHPKGEGLFDQLPDNLEELLAGGNTGGGEPTFEQRVNKMTKDHLIELATSLNLDAEGTVKELKARIIENGETPAEPKEES